MPTEPANRHSPRALEIPPLGHIQPVGHVVLKGGYSGDRGASLVRIWGVHLGDTMQKKLVFNRYLAGLASTLAGAWLSSAFGSMIPLAMGASFSLTCTAPLVRQIWTRRAGVADRQQ